MEEQEAEGIASIKSHNPLLSFQTWANFQIQNSLTEEVSRF